MAFAAPMSSAPPAETTTPDYPARRVLVVALLVGQCPHDHGDHKAGDAGHQAPRQQGADDRPDDGQTGQPVLVRADPRVGCCERPPCKSRRDHG